MKSPKKIGAKFVLIVSVACFVAGIAVGSYAENAAAKAREFSAAEYQRLSSELDQDYTAMLRNRIRELEFKLASPTPSSERP